MTTDEFGKLWVVFYAFADAAFGITPVERWLKDEKECYLKMKPSGCVIVDITETREEAEKRQGEFEKKKR